PNSGEKCRRPEFRTKRSWGAETEPYAFRAFSQAVPSTARRSGWLAPRMQGERGLRAAIACWADVRIPGSGHRPRQQPKAVRDLRPGIVSRLPSSQIRPSNSHRASSSLYQDAIEDLAE